MRRKPSPPTPNRRSADSYQLATGKRSPSDRTRAELSRHTRRYTCSWKSKPPMYSVAPRDRDPTISVQQPPCTRKPLQGVPQQQQSSVAIRHFSLPITSVPSLYTAVRKLSAVLLSRALAPAVDHHFALQLCIMLSSQVSPAEQIPGGGPHNPLAPSDRNPAAVAAAGGLEGTASPIRYRIQMPYTSSSTRKWPWELLATQAPPARVHVTLLTNGCMAESPVGNDCCGRGGAPYTPGTALPGCCSDR